jgi:phage baseplate assembly protein W
MANTYLRWPLRVDASGRFETTSNPDDIWADRLVQVIACRVGERVMRSDYGTAVLENLWENDLGADPKDVIRAAVARWLPHITVLDVIITQPDPAMYEVNVTYSTPDRKHLTTTIGLDATGANQ